MMRRLILPLAVWLGFLALLFLPAWVHGVPSQFPLLQTNVDPKEYGLETLDSDLGRCSSGGYVAIQLIATDHRTGWIVYYHLERERLVALRYSLAEKGTTTEPDLVVFAVIEKDYIVVRREEPFNPTLHMGPCDWLDAKDT